jgi:hypothetical protein
MFYKQHQLAGRVLQGVKMRQGCDVRSHSLAQKHADQSAPSDWVTGHSCMHLKSWVSHGRLHFLDCCPADRPY